MKCCIQVQYEYEWSMLDLVVRNLLELDSFISADIYFHFKYDLGSNVSY